MKRFLIVLLCLLIVCVSALADTVYILCQPDSFVNVREYPVKNGRICGRLEIGEEVETDGIKKNGFIHLIGTGFESGDTWVNLGFVTEDPVTVRTFQGWIESEGRVACRRSINGTRRKWLKKNTDIIVYAYAYDWSITNHGFIQTQYIGGF